jgi:hypothetical protein
MQKHKLPNATYAWISTQEQKVYSEKEFEELLKSHMLTSYSKNIIIQACLYALCIANGLNKEIIVLSDDAGQFKVFDNHALCWVHAIRAIKKIIPVSNDEASEIDRIEDLIWQYYSDLDDYRQNPSDEQKKILSDRFDVLFSTPTKSLFLPAILKGFLDKKEKLLLVLDHPLVPLHNNTAERDLRHVVIHRKISGGTRSENGRKARDVFFTLFKTCQKNGISMFNFLADRMKKINQIPNLGDIIRQRNAELAAASPP